MVLTGSIRDRKIREEIVVKNYDKDLGINEITDRCRIEISNISRCVVSRILKSKKLPIKEKRGKITERKNMKNPFQIGNADNEYWLGVLLADGGLSKQGSNIYLYSSDIDYIRTLNAHAGIRCSESIRTKSVQNNLCLYFGNQAIWNYLYSIGVTPNKSLTLNPNIELNWNIIRGIFDGDGCVAKGEFKITTGSISMVDKLTKFFEQHKFRTVIVQKGRAFDVYIRYTNGNCNRKVAETSKKRLFQLLYPENCRYWLDRKKQAISALL